MSTSAPIFQAILLSISLVLVFSRLSIRVSARLGLIDFPNSAPHKQHSRATPLAGGLALMATLLVSEALMGNFHDRSLQATFLAAGVVFLFGIWDDLKSLPPLVKLSGQILASLVLIVAGVHIRIFESPGFFIQVSGDLKLYLDWLVTVFWIVGIVNAFNFVDSMDGLTVGLAGMASAFFVLVTLDAQQPLLSLHSALILGVCLGLYFFNSPPAKLFLGDAGAQTLGLVLAALAIVYSPPGFNQSSSWFVPILLLGVPIFDTTLVVYSRLRRRKPVYSAARDHTYHRLLSFGLEPLRAVLVMQGAALFLGCLAFIVLPLSPALANLVFVAVLVVAALALSFLDRRCYWVERYHLEPGPSNERPRERLTPGSLPK